MFNEIITFLQVVKYGSFSKASQIMFLTPNAIKKRIRSLEEQTGILLFHRTNKGVSLTEAGESLFRDFSAIYEQYEKSLERAARIQNRSDRAICIGMMNTFSDTFITSNWHEIPRKFQHNPLHIVYYGESLYDLHELFSDVGTKIDLCIDLFDPYVAKQYGLQAQKISEYPLYIGMPENALIEKKIPVTFDMLKGQTLSLLQKGRCTVYDSIYNEIVQKYPEIIIEEIENYNIRTFHNCYEYKNYILVTKNQIDLYPFYVFHPLEPEITVAFGIYFPMNAKNQVKELISKILSGS